MTKKPSDPIDPREIWIIDVEDRKRLDAMAGTNASVPVKEVIKKLETVLSIERTTAIAYGAALDVLEEEKEKNYER